MNQMDANDAHDVTQAQAGDELAFRRLVERHGRGVFQLAFRLTGSETDAEDVVQDTFLKAYRELKRFEARSSFRTWVHRITVNCAYDLLRQRPRHKAESMDVGGRGGGRREAGSSRRPTRRWARTGSRSARRSRAVSGRRWAC